MEQLPANFLGKNSASFKDIFRQPKEQLFCELSENFVTAIVSKASFRVSAEFSTSRIYIFCFNKE